MTVETRSPTAVGTNAWTNNTNAYSNNGTDATCAPGKNLSVLGIWKTYGFTLGAEATISAVEVGIDWWVSTTISKASMNIEISWDGGATWGAHAWAEADTEAHVATGGDTHWFVCTADTAWTPTKTNDTNLQVRISGVQGNSSTAVTFYLDYVPVRITYATIVTSPAKKCVYHMRNTVNNPRKFPYHIRNLVFYGYAYKASLIISGSTEAVTYYQIKLIINKTSGTNSAGTIYLNDHSLNWPYDICFKNSSGGNLDFWRESYDTNTMTVWVECDSVPISPGTATFFIYYGKSGAADVSNGSNTFVFFDDFPGAAIDTDKWGGDTASTTVSSSILTIYGATAWKSIQSLITSSPPAALRMKTQIDGAGVSAWNDCGFRDPVTTDMVTLYAGNPTKLRNYNSGTGTTVDSNWDGNQNIYDILWTTTSTRFYQNAAELTNSPISTNAPSKALPAAFSCYAAAGTADIHCDWVLIRKYLGTEPGYGAFGTESVAENSTRRFVYNILSEISTISKGIVFKYNISGILAKTIKLLYNIMPNIFLHLYFVKNSLNPFMAPNGAWEGSLNICDEWIIEEPTELRLYYTGHAEGATSGIGLATSPKTYSPMNWTRDNGNPIYSDGTFVRMGSIQKVAGTYFMYYQAGITGQYVGLATSSDGKAFTKYGNVLTISGDEITVEDASVINIDATHWYMYYAYRTASSTLPGIRVATSPDGYEWTKQSGDVLNTGTSGTWDDTYIEHHQIMYTGGYYFLIYEAYSGTNWAGGLAYSVSPTSAFTKYSGNPIIEKSGISGAFDEFHVATPYIFPFNDDWYIFFVGGNVLSPYGDSVWEMGLAGRLYTSKKSVYHIRNRLSVVSKSVYNIRYLLSSARGYVYHIRNLVSSSKKLIYNILNRLSVAFKSVYNIRNAISSVKKYVYHTRNILTAASKSIYHIRKYVAEEYSYRSSFIVSGSTAEAVINYQIRLIINKDSGTNSSGTIYLNNKSLNWPYDVRFRNSVGGNLPFWRESYDANTMTVWVKCDSIPISPGTATFYIYYGKTGDSDASNPTTALVYFDDATSDKSSNYILSDLYLAGNPTIAVTYQDSSNGYMVDSSVTEDCFGLAITGVSGSSFAMSSEHKPTFFSPDDNVQFGHMARYISGTGVYELRQVRASTGGSVKFLDIQKEATPPGTQTIISTSNNTNPIASGSWYTISSKIHSSSFWLSSSHENKIITTSDSSYTTGKWGLYYYMTFATDPRNYFKNINVKNYVSPEPGYGAFGTEEGVENISLLFIYNLAGIVKATKEIILKYNIGGKISNIKNILYGIMPNFFMHLNFTREPDNPLMVPTEDWEGVGGPQINIGDFPIIEEDTELRMYYTGFASTIKNGIGLATCPKVHPPKPWTKYGKVFAPDDTPGQWDTGWIRLGNVLKINSSTYWMYYEGSPNLSEGGTDRIGLATSSNGINWTRYGSNPILTISGDETEVENPTVVRVDATHWYMYYCYRTSGAILPGLRIATSSDGYVWTKQAGDILSKGASGQWDDTYIEHSQIYLIDGWFVIAYESVGGTAGEPWSVGIAYNQNPTSVFTKYSGNPIFTSSEVGGAFDQYHVATPNLFKFGDIWYLFYQGGNVDVPYGDSTWKMGLAGRLYTSKKSVYHIRNLLAVISKLIYHIRNRINAISIQIYNIISAISVSNAIKYIYNIRNLISSINKSIYHMRNITSSAKKFVYHIRNVLSAVSSKSIYHIRNILSTSSKYVYKIRNTISAISKSIYNIAGALVSSLKAIYNMRNLLSVSSKSVYNIRNLISSAKKLVYHIWNKSAATIKAFYNIIGISAAILRAVYHIRNITSASRKSFYHIRNVLAVISKSIYHIRNILSAISKSVYRIRNLTSSINTSVYHIRNALVVSFKSIYNIWNIVSSSKKYIYRIWNKAAAIIKSIYNILGTPSAYLKSIYHMRNLTSSSKRSVYHIRNLVNSIKLSVYHIRNIITSASKSIYKIWNKVSSVRTQIYHIRNSVSQSTKKMVYDIRATISKSLISIYNIITSVNISNAIRAIYHIRGRIESIKSYAYKIGGGLIKALTAIYRIRGLVSGSSRFPYNIRTIISNAEKYIYNIFKNILTSDIYTYTIRGLVSSGKKLMYNIVGRIVSAKNLVYNIRGMISSSPKLFTYSIRKGIQSVKSYLYIIFNFTNASNKFVYTIRNYTVASKKYAYNILNKISSIKSFPYNIRNSIASSMLYSYNIFEQISAAVSSSYIINGIASALLKMVYNIFVYICPDLIGPYYALTGELYNYFNNMTGTGGELEGFTIYKSKPRNTALFFPCIVISVENTRQDDVYGGNYMETATTSIELMFTKKDSHIYTVDSKQITLMQDQLARFYKVKLLELAKGFVSDSINMADSQITATTYGPTRPQHTIYGVKLIVQFAFKGIYWKK